MWPPKRWEIESGHIRISSWVQGERRRRRRRETERERESAEEKKYFEMLTIILFCWFKTLFYLKNWVAL
jgi:hypothetical protein